MSSLAPMVHNISAFDKNVDKIITFNWDERNNQIVGNRCIIRDNATNAIVYDITQNNLNKRHIIYSENKPEQVGFNNLTNGRLYNLTLQVITKDALGNNQYSQSSTPVLFYCFTTPTLSIIDITDGQIIRNPFYSAKLAYSQTEGELIQSYQYFLYDASNHLIWGSGVKYNTENPLEMPMNLNDLADNGFYKIQATCITVNGIESKSDLISFSVEYINPNAYALISLENIYDIGQIKIESNIISLVGRYDGIGEPNYLNNEFINLKDSRNKVNFDKDFQINGNFTLNIKGYDFTKISKILEMSDTSGGKISVIKLDGTYVNDRDPNKIYFELRVSGAFSNYTIFSNVIDKGATTDIISIWIRRRNNLYNIFCVNLTQEGGAE